MRRAVVCWCGESMKADPLPAAWNGSSTVERTVTILGATGSIGASTVDLLKRERKRFRIEAVSANKNAGALPAGAREPGAWFAAIRDPTAHRELQSPPPRTGIKAAAGQNRVVQAA